MRGIHLARDDLGIFVTHLQAQDGRRRMVLDQRFEVRIVRATAFLDQALVGLQLRGEGAVRRRRTGPLNWVA
jgi:hypothetical protein